MMRLDKIMSDAGFGTRSEVRSLIRQGLVTVNGVAVRDPARKTDPVREEIRAEGAPVLWQAFSYYMMNKPAGIITASEDRREKTVTDLIPGKKRRDLFPVGRLDRDTEGLLLITNDGRLAHRLLSPAHHVEKEYHALIRGPYEEAWQRAFSAGLDIGDETPAAPARLRRLSEKEAAELPRNTGAPVSVILTEGRFHEVKRLFAAVGSEVLYLRRVRMGDLRLDPLLQPGESRDLTPAERKLLDGSL